MKTKRLLIPCLAITLATVLSASEAPVQPSKAAQKFMRKKLEYSQKVFEGIVLEKYDIVARNAVQLSRVVETNSYFFSRDTYYLESTAQFRGDVAELYNAAIATNSTDVMTAYKKVATDCVSCHQQFHRAHLPRILGRS